MDQKELAAALRKRPRTARWLLQHGLSLSDLPPDVRVGMMELDGARCVWWLQPRRISRRWKQTLAAIMPLREAKP